MVCTFKKLGVFFWGLPQISRLFIHALKIKYIKMFGLPVGFWVYKAN